MRPDDKEMARLWDMLDASRAITEFIAGMRFEDFLKDRKTRNSVERNLEIIGEAARHLSPQTRENYPEIPWRSIIALRNIIAHDYGEILYENLWIICTNRLLILIDQLEAMGVDHFPADDE